MRAVLEGAATQPAQPAKTTAESWIASLGLSARQAELVRLALAGQDASAICGRLAIARSTYRKHVHEILARTGHARIAHLVTE